MSQEQKVEATVPVAVVGAGVGVAAVPEAIPERCPVRLGSTQCVREFGHPGLHCDAGALPDVLAGTAPGQVPL